MGLDCAVPASSGRNLIHFLDVQIMIGDVCTYMSRMSNHDSAKLRQSANGNLRKVIQLTQVETALLAKEE